MTKRHSWLITGVILIVVILGLVIRNQVKVYRGRQARAALNRARAAVIEQRQTLFDLVQPIAISNCQLERFGEANDGGYLMCGNLLGAIESGYSYGIAGYDKWGCDISTKHRVPVHQYDCFVTDRPECPAGKTVFHTECVGDVAETVDGRVFDTIRNQFAKNGDSSKRIVLKIDVEGAEWDSLLATPDETLSQIDQLTAEFHWVQGKDGWIEDDKYLRVVRRLKQFFEIAHIHYNNSACVGGLEPFPTWTYEVLFVSKRLAVVDPTRKPSGLHPLDTPNDPRIPECLPKMAWVEHPIVSPMVMIRVRARGPQGDTRELGPSVPSVTTSSCGTLPRPAS
jgi:hypothetical protein